MSWQVAQAGTPGRRSTDRPVISAHDLQHINLQLASLGKPVCRLDTDESYLAIAESLLKQYTLQRRLLAEYRSPADRRIEGFLNTWLGEQGVHQPVSLPQASFILDQPGLARVLSLPLEQPEFHSPYVDSYRLLQGVLHNPRYDRRTTSPNFLPGGAAGLHFVEGREDVANGQKAVCFQVMPAPALAGSRAPAFGIPVINPG